MSIAYAYALEMASAPTMRPRSLHARTPDRFEVVAQARPRLVTDEEHPLDRGIGVEPGGDRLDVERAIRRTLEDLDVEVVLRRLVDDARAEEPVVADQALAELRERQEAALVGAGPGRRHHGGKVVVRALDPDELLEVALGGSEHVPERILPVVVAGRVRE